MTTGGTAQPLSDLKVRNEVGNPTKSFLVRAPAGAGKTQLLAERYVRLLAQRDVAAENIVCITFTRKAAGEMRRRIGEILTATINTTKPEPGAAIDSNMKRAGERLRELLDEEKVKRLASRYGNESAARRQINVQTIDGFQRSLVRADSFRAHIMPNFGMADSYRVFNRAVGQEVDWNDPLAQVPANFSSQQVHGKMVDMLKKRDQWMRKVSSPPWVLEKLKVIAEKTLDRIFAVEGEYDYTEVSRAAEQLVEKATLAGLESALGYSIRHILVDEFQDVSEAQSAFLQSCVKGWGNDEETTFFAVGDSMQSIYRFRGAGTDVIFALFEGETGGGTATFGGRELSVEQLRVNFRSRATIVNGVYNLLLSREEEETEQLREQTRKEKEEKLKELQKERLKELQEERLKKGAALLQKPNAHRDTLPASSEGPGKFCVMGFRGTDEKEAQEKVQEKEAKWVAEMMEGCRDRKQELAVLVRARSHYSNFIEPKLSDRKDIDVGFTPLDRYACVRDMIALGRCIEDTEDKVTCLALLRSPLVGIGTKEIVALYRWLQRLNRPDAEAQYATPLDALLKNGLEEDIRIADALDRASIQTWVATIQRARAEMGRTSVRERLERAWSRMGGGVVYCREEDLKNVEQLLDLVETLSGRGGHCDWRELEESAIRQKHGATRFPDAPVKVMTIHAAKGLEFKRVIVPFLHIESQTLKRDLVMFKTLKKKDENGKEISRTYDAFCDGDGDKENFGQYDCLRSKEQDKNREEIRRLLYVAATRAEDECYLTFSADIACEKFWSSLNFEKSKKPPMMAAINDLGKKEKCFSKMFEVFEEDKEKKTHSEEGEEKKTDEGRLRVGDFKKLGEHVESKASLCTPRVFRAWGHASYKDAAVGEVVHEELATLLEEWPAEGVDGTLADPEWKRECGSKLQEKGWMPTDGGVDEGVKDVTGHLQCAYNDPRAEKLAELIRTPGEWSLEFEKEFESKEALCDGDFAGRVKRLDLIIWNETKKVCLIIDFKTGEPQEAHKDQVRCYEKFVGTAWSDFSVASTLFYTSAQPKAKLVIKPVTTLPVFTDFPFA